MRHADGLRGLRFRVSPLPRQAPRSQIHVTAGAASPTSPKPGDGIARSRDAGATTRCRDAGRAESCSGAKAGTGSAALLVIHPDECIDCGVCEPECPAEAIKPDTEAGLESWLALNRDYAAMWPNLTTKRDALPDAKEWDGKPDKLALLSPEPGEGD